MTPQELQYVQRTIERHIEFHFHEKAVASYKAADIAWIEWDAVCGEGWSEDASIIIPIVPKDLPRQVTWNVPFRDTSLVLWNRLPLPEGWQCDHDEAPLWYRGPQGYQQDLVGTAFDLLTMQEERASQRRDAMAVRLPVCRHVRQMADFRFL